MTVPDMNTLDVPRVAKVARRIRMALASSGIGFSLFDDRIKAGNQSIFINVEELAKAVLEAI